MVAKAMMFFVVLFLSSHVCYSQYKNSCDSTILAQKDSITKYKVAYIILSERIKNSVAADTLKYRLIYTTSELNNRKKYEPLQKAVWTLGGLITGLILMLKVN